METVRTTHSEGEDAVADKAAPPEESVAIVFMIAIVRTV